EANCTTPCSSWVSLNGAFFRTLTSGSNTMILTGMVAGENAIGILSPPSFLEEKTMNHTIAFHIDLTAACMGITCMNNGTCVSQPNPAYSTAYTCSCVY